MMTSLLRFKRGKKVTIKRRVKIFFQTKGYLGMKFQILILNRQKFQVFSILACRDLQRLFHSAAHPKILRRFWVQKMSQTCVRGGISILSVAPERTCSG